MTDKIISTADIDKEEVRAYVLVGLSVARAGLSQGIFQKRDTTVLEMLRENEPHEKIMRYTRVTPERLDALRQMV